MLKNKIDDEALQELETEFENKAKLKTNKKGGRPKKEKGDVEEIMNVYNIPKKWIEAIKERQIPFSIYAKMAIETKLKADGWL